jgi:hypothetical protein
MHLLLRAVVVAADGRGPIVRVLHAFSCPCHQMLQPGAHCDAHAA